MLYEVITFSDLITRDKSMMDIVCAFLAVLESVKQKRILILQNKLLGDILIRQREEEPEKAEVTDGIDE